MSKYIGNELELFENARNWKNYYGSFIKPLLGLHVAEIGAGIGGTTLSLYNVKQESWLCVEPDAALVSEIDQKIFSGKLPAVCQSYTGYAADLKEQFDSVLYIDVIEHIEADEQELKKAYELLRPGGRLFIIVPAHNSLFSAFDKMIGHYRRYSRASLKKIIPSGLRIEKNYYLDSMGYFASLINRLWLKQSIPTSKQIKFWDSYIVPVSRKIDRITGYSFGKSILLIAQKTG
jgi:SAM-dependent methyltransferase